MKVLVIHNLYRSRNIGGEDLVFQNEVKYLRVLLGSDNVYTYSVSTDDLTFKRLLESLFFSISNYKKVFNIIKNENIDIVHVHNFFPLLSPSVFAAAKKAGAKVVLTLHNYRLWCISGTLYKDGCGICEECLLTGHRYHGIAGKCYRNSLLQSLITTIAFSFYQRFNLYKYIDKYFVLTEFQKRKVEEFGLDKNKIIVKPNLIERFNNSAIEPENRMGYLFIGRLEEYKGIKNLLEVWEKLSPNYRLTVIGTGPLESLVRRYAESFPNIQYKGQLDHNETMEAVKKAKYLIHSSLVYETFGLTIIEAFSVGVPVIGLKIGTRNDLIDNEYTGFLCDRPHLKDTIIKADNYKDYKLLSDNCREFVRQFLWKKVIADQVDIYSRILDEEIRVS